MTPRVPILDTDTDTAETFRLALGGLWVQSSALNPRTGVTSTPVLTGTGNLTATVGPFTAMIDGTSGALQGGYPVALDTAGTVTIGAGNTQARIDLISLQIKDNNYDASGLHQGQLVVTAGTPSGSPVAPAAPANSISLWTVPVAANATSVTWASATAVFPYTAAAGGIVAVRNATDQPAAPGAVQYRHRLDVTAAAGSNSPLESSVDGTTWKPVYDASAVPASTSSAITSAISGLYGSFTALTLGTNWSVFGNAPQMRVRPGGIEFRGSMQSTATINDATQLLSGGWGIGTQRYLPWQLLNGTTNGYIQINTGGTATLHIAIASTLPSGSIITLDGMSIVP